MNGFKPNLAGRNYVSEGTHGKIWAFIACVAPPRGEAATFLSAYMSPARLTPSEKTADFGVESRDPIWQATAFFAKTNRSKDLFVV